MLKPDTKSKRKVEVFAMAHLSAKEQEIDESREEVLSLLHEFSSSESELSIANVVVEERPISSSSAIKDMAQLVKERKMSSSNNRKSFGSSGDGVLLNFYVPTMLARSLTAPRGSRRIVDKNTMDCKRRDRELATFGCWSALWQRRHGRSRKQVLK